MEQVKLRLMSSACLFLTIYFVLFGFGGGALSIIADDLENCFTIAILLLLCAVCAFLTYFTRCQLEELTPASRVKKISAEHRWEMRRLFWLLLGAIVIFSILGIAMIMISDNEAAALFFVLDAACASFVNRVNTTLTDQGGSQ